MVTCSDLMVILRYNADIVGAFEDMLMIFGWYNDDVMALFR